MIPPKCGRPHPRQRSLVKGVVLAVLEARNLGSFLTITGMKEFDEQDLWDVRVYVRLAHVDLRVYQDPKGTAETWGSYEPSLLVFFCQLWLKFLLALQWGPYVTPRKSQHKGFWRV